MWRRHKVLSIANWTGSGWTFPASIKVRLHCRSTPSLAAWWWGAGFKSGAVLWQFVFDFISLVSWQGWMAASCRVGWVRDCLMSLWEWRKLQVMLGRCSGGWCRQLTLPCFMVHPPSCPRANPWSCQSGLSSPAFYRDEYWRKTFLPSKMPHGDILGRETPRVAKWCSRACYTSVYREWGFQLEHSWRPAWFWVGTYGRWMRGNICTICCRGAQSFILTPHCIAVVFGLYPSFPSITATLLRPELSPAKCFA